LYDVDLKYLHLNQVFKLWTSLKRFKLKN